jgi:hypothetical protein
MECKKGREPGRGQRALLAHRQWRWRKDQRKKKFEFVHPACPEVLADALRQLHASVPPEVTGVFIPLLIN